MAEYTDFHAAATSSLPEDQCALALHYAAHGVPVFPVHATGKKMKAPATRKGFHDASTDEDTIRSWFSGANRYTVAACPASFGCTVIDLDNKIKVNGLDRFADLEDEHGVLETLEASTPTEGAHLYVQAPHEGVSNAHQLGEGIDIRGAGGYVLLPGAITKTGRYRVLYDDAIAACPGWIAERLGQAEPKRPALTVVPKDPVPEGERNNHLAKVAGRLLNTGIEFPVLCNALMSENLHRCVPPMSEDEVLAVARSISRYEHHDPEAEEIAVEGLGVFLREFEEKRVAEAREHPVSTVAELREALPAAKHTWLPDLKTTAKGAPAANQLMTHVNLAALIERLGIELRFNMMTKDFEFSVPGVSFECRPGQTSGLVLSAIDDVCQTLGMNNAARFSKNIVTLAESSAYHPMEDWILSEPWDGRRRFDELAATVSLHDEDDARVWRTVLHRWLIQTVEAVRNWREVPGQKSGVLVLVGPQGCRKTTWLGSLLPGAFFREGVALHLSSYSARDSIVEALGSAVAELGELETTFTKSDAGALKNFLSKSEDKLRLPYGERWVTWPRTVSFCGSVNHAAFLVDDTGSRRFWPIDVKWCDTDRVRGMHLQQLWAEANEWWESGEQWWLTPEEEDLRASYADRFTSTDVTIDRLEAWLEARPSTGPKTPVTVTNVMELNGLNPYDKKGAGSVTNRMKEVFGPSKQHKKVRRSWLVRLTSEERADVGRPAGSPELVK